MKKQSEREGENRPQAYSTVEQSVEEKTVQDASCSSKTRMSLIADNFTNDERADGGCGPQSKSVTEKKEDVSAFSGIESDPPQSSNSTNTEKQEDVEQGASVRKTNKEENSKDRNTSEGNRRSKETNRSFSSIVSKYITRNSIFQYDASSRELADTDEDEDHELEVVTTHNLSEDTFSFMKINSILSWTWFFAMVVYLMQLLLVAMIMSQQIFSSREGTPFDIPFKVDGTTRVAQVMAIIFIVFMSKDVVMPIREVSLLWITNDKQWSKVIGLLPNDTNSRPGWLVWVVRILLPNFLQFAQGTLMLVISFIIIIQTDDVISLFADFAAMFIISDLDNIAFELAKNGYFGEKLATDAHFVQNLELEDRTSMLFCYVIPLRPLILVAVFLITLGSFIPVVWNQVNGTYFRNKFPNCAIASADISKIGDGFCDGGLFNSFECGFDGGDCALFNVAFPSCKVQNPQEIGDGICQEQYKSDECGFDSLDCCEGDKSLISNGVCNPLYNTAICSWDGGDCKISGFEFCHVNSTEKIGDGECDGLPFNTAACGWDGSDCLQHNQNFIVTYPNCIVFDSTFVGNGRCDGGDYMEEACNFDGGDCDAFMEKYPDCNATDPWRLGDGKCDLEDYMTYECGWDGGDCIDQQFPNCTISDEYKALFGDGVCQVGDNAYYNSAYAEQTRNEECGFDGGDCERYYGE